MNLLYPANLPKRLLDTTQSKIERQLRSSFANFSNNRLQDVLEHSYRRIKYQLHNGGLRDVLLMALQVYLYFDMQTSSRQLGNVFKKFYIYDLQHFLKTSSRPHIKNIKKCFNLLISTKKSKGKLISLIRFNCDNTLSVP